MNTRRGIKTIIGSFFRKRGQMGAEASSAAFLASVGFVIAISLCVISFIFWWFPYHLFSDEVYNIVVVNAPESFKEFNSFTIIPCVDSGGNGSLILSRTLFFTDGTVVELE